MVVWKKTMITGDFLLQHHMPVSSGYFQKKDGTEVECSMFDYVRNHLGYRIELQSLQLPSKFVNGKENVLKLSLGDRGFATIFGEHPAYFVLIGNAGGITGFPTDTNPKSWQPFEPKDSAYTSLMHTVDVSLELPASVTAGTYKLGLWTPDRPDRLGYNPRYAIHCANGDTGRWISKDGKYSANVLTAVGVK